MDSYADEIIFAFSYDPLKFLKEELNNILTIKPTEDWPVHPKLPAVALTMILKDQNVEIIETTNTHRVYYVERMTESLLRSLFKFDNRHETNILGTIILRSIQEKANFGSFFISIKN
uniref:Uncharacterized protein n=1 Tax=viral metagenome TaxID=1070528 RepID=A0A6C0J853_9ZZZZ